ncbi:hypothetical protein [Candidatus Amarobacter glycogenicus]|uniref:hypothetical protein n=1 Tax=Candidatus Amarobacter glycogenicus TaxID=3140699 RepID=UPI002A185EF0|nr:hypothetical protein [Dehalococcoidia bacterium]
MAGETSTSLSEINQPGSFKPAVYLKWLDAEQSPMSFLWDTWPLAVEVTRS